MELQTTTFDPLLYNNKILYNMFFTVMNCDFQRTN